MKKNSIVPASLKASLSFVVLLSMSVAGRASVIYVTATDGGIYQFDSVTDMSAQSNTTTSGTLVATISAYGSDQGTTMDLSTGFVYRVTGAGDVVSYGNLSGYLANSGGDIVATGV